MEVIKRKICLEDYTSRVPGLIPPINNTLPKDGNWGFIISDIDFRSINLPNEYKSLSTFGIMSYRNLMDRYYSLLKILKKNEYYQYVVNYYGKYDWIMYNKDIELINNYTLYNSLAEVINPSKGTIVAINKNKKIFDSFGGKVFIDFIERSIGKIKIPQAILNIGKRVPSYIYIVDIERYYNLLLNLKDTEDCCTNVKYIDYGGDEMLSFLSDKLNLFESEKNIFKNISSKPNLNISLLIKSTIDDMGLLTTDLPTWVKGEKYKIGTTVLYNGDSYVLKSGNADNTYVGYYDEVFKVLYFDEWDSNKNEYVHWKKSVSPSLLPSGNKVVMQGESKLLSLKRPIRSYDDDDVEIPGVLKPQFDGDNKKIGYYSDLDLFFSENIVYRPKREYVNENVFLTYGDIMTSITYKGTDKIQFIYVIGGLVEVNKDKDIYISDGLTYIEEYYYTKESINLKLDGKINTYYYTNIDFDSAKVNIINENVKNSSKNVILSNIEYYADSLLEINNDDSRNVVYAPLFKEEYLNGISSPPIINIDVTIERGASSAFERHLKLQEIKTFQDLEEYSNNSFFKMK